MIMMRSRSNPTSPTSGGSGSDCRSARQILVEEGRLAKSRRLVDGYLRRIGSDLHRDLSLNKQGVAYLPFQKFILVIEVPEDQFDKCILYTMVCRLREGEPAFTKVLATAMRLNYLHTGTGGSTLGWEGEEVNLCMALTISGLHQAQLHDAIKAFMSTASSTHELLEGAKR
jgi:Tir chaperone protein (CesT) family